MERKTFLVASAGALLGGCTGPATAGTALYERIDGRSEPLRSAFNRDVDKVRIVMLVSPT